MLIINYYLNSLETKDLIKSAKEVKGASNSRYEVTMLNPQYYSYNQKKQKLFIQAEYANKDKKQINMSKPSGYIQLQNGIKLECKAEHGEIRNNIKQIVLKDNIVLSSSNDSKLITKELLIDYDKYQFSSNEKATLWYKNITLTAMKFSFNKKMIKLFDSVKVKIKAIA